MKFPHERDGKVGVRAIVLIPLAAFGLALGINVFIKRQHPPEAVDAKRVAPPVAAKAEGLPAKALGKTDRLSDTLLTDSILSIVQSYYVDPERVDNRSLVTTALAALSSNPRVKSGWAADSVWVEVDGDRQTFPLKENPRYQDILETFTAVAQALDASGVAVAAGETPEKGAPGAVVLLNSMLAELDAHSALLSPDAYKELRQGTEGAFGGLGVLVGIREHLLTVIKPLPRSPAQRAGIKKHDRILGIDGVDTYGYTLDELVEYMRGDPGTEVKLHLLRDGAQSPSEMALKREVIKVDSVQAEDVERNGVTALHLTIENFASRTSREVLNAIKHFRDRHGGSLPGLVLDLRSNPGGLLDQAVQVADLFLQEGVIVSTKGRREEVESAGSGIDEVDFPVTVLIDGDSASASEIVAGALQDHGRGVVIGQPSFGKGSVQTIFELPGERALKLTIARYYTPAGRSIQNVGIIPDVWLQPVARGDVNENLFGPYRYKNERFLRNHLELAKEAPASKRDQANQNLPVRKAYYLAEARVDDDEPRKVDVELDLAMAMIKKIHDTYGNKLPDGTGRSSHWLGLAGPVVSPFAEKLDAEARTWISSHYKVDWSRSAADGAAQGHAAARASDVGIELADLGPVTAQPGGKVAVRYRLVNHMAQRTDRVSVFVRSDQPGFDTREVLVGAVESGSTRDGLLDVQIPASWEPGPLLLRIGAAVDAWPSRSGSADLLVQIGTRATATLKADVTLAGESGAHADGVLEAREKAKLRVSLQNDGEIPARNLQVRLINLSGTQVQVDSKPRPVEVVERGAEKDVFISIEGAKVLYSPEVTVGLLVEGPDLRVPVRQKFSLRVLPNAKISKAGTNLIGH